MAELWPKILDQDLIELKELLWGLEIKQDIFRRWSQGFVFSTKEKSALEQAEGGPCAIIAPVQAFIIKNLLLEYENLTFRDKIDSLIQCKILVNAICEILGQCCRSHYFIASIVKDDVNEHPSNSDHQYEMTFNSVKFHEDLDVIQLQTLADVHQYYMTNIRMLYGNYGVLLFLYSVILSRGLIQIREECGDTQDPLIDKTYGYGSQTLINLMITGKATTYVWDNYQDIAGLKLKGIEKQSEVGFITLMEYHRFCTVGSFYKNPKHPIWVIGSDTHLTVLFSDERKLVNTETKSERARRIFQSYDPDGNNFINSDKLQEVLQALDLVSETEYVNIIKKKLDNESLGIILLNAFMEEFFPKEESSIPDIFTLLHYNGLLQSNLNAELQYRCGSAILLESDIKSVCESNPMLTVLQTKWPSIEVNWLNGPAPSLN